ncbi:hypothetical protein Hanom_Chr07g00621811 [Helianthus anomalus]
MKECLLLYYYHKETSQIATILCSNQMHHLQASHFEHYYPYLHYPSLHHSKNLHTLLFHLVEHYYSPTDSSSHLG